MEVFLKAKVNELCKKTKNPYLMSWDNWEQPVKELLSLSKAMNLESDEYEKAVNDAVAAVARLKGLTNVQCAKIEVQDTNAIVNHLRA